MQQHKYFFPPSKASDARLALVDDKHKHEPTYYYLGYTCFIASQKILSEKGLGTFFVWPAMGLFRQSIELLMKSILIDLLGRSVREVAGFSHDLDKLLEEVLVCRSKLRASLSPNEESFLKEAVHELAEIDPKGDAFKYALTRDGTRHWKDWPDKVDSKALADVCQCVFHKVHDLHGFPDSERGN